MKKILLIGLLALMFVVISGCVQPPVCPNSVCEAGEDQYSCPQDCGGQANSTLIINVQDPEGNPISAATVDLYEFGTGPIDTLATDAYGIVKFSIPPSTYSVKVSKKGFENNASKEFKLGSQEDIVIGIILQPIQYHSECSNEQCIKVEGVGNNQCVQDSDCQSPTFKLRIGDVTGKIRQQVEIPVYIEALEADKPIARLQIEIKENPLLDINIISFSDIIKQYCYLDSNPNRQDIEAIIIGSCSGSLPKSKEILITTLKTNLQQVGENTLAFSFLEVVDNSNPPKAYHIISNSGKVSVSEEAKTYQLRTTTQLVNSSIYPGIRSGELGIGAFVIKPDFSDFESETFEFYKSTDNGASFVKIGEASKTTNAPKTIYFLDYSSNFVNGAKYYYKAVLKGTRIETDKSSQTICGTDSDCPVGQVCNGDWSCSAKDNTICTVSSPEITDLSPCFYTAYNQYTTFRCYTDIRLQTECQKACFDGQCVTG